MRRFSFITMSFCMMTILQCANPPVLGVNHIYSVGHYLKKGEKEHASNSWYSYFIIPSPPTTDTDTANYIKLHRAFKTVFLPKRSTVTSGNQGYINTVYWLLDSLPTSDTSDLYFVQHYDYGRADSLVKGLKDWKQNDERLTGIYFIFDSEPILSTKPEYWTTLEKYDFRCGKSDEYQSLMSWMKEQLNQYQPLKINLNRKLFGKCF